MVSRAEVNTDFAPEADTELGLVLGHVVIVTQQDDSGWWEGYVEGTPAAACGWFPAEFVTLLPAQPPQAQQHTPPPAVVPEPEPVAHVPTPAAAAHGHPPGVNPLLGDLSQKLSARRATGAQIPDPALNKPHTSVANAAPPPWANRGGAAHPHRGGAAHPPRGGAAHPHRGGAAHPPRGGAAHPPRGGGGGVAPRGGMGPRGGMAPRGGMGTRGGMGARGGLSSGPARGGMTGAPPGGGAMAQAGLGGMPRGGGAAAMHASPRGGGAAGGRGAVRMVPRGRGGMGVPPGGVHASPRGGMGHAPGRGRGGSGIRAAPLQKAPLPREQPASATSKPVAAPVAAVAVTPAALKARAHVPASAPAPAPVSVAVAVPSEPSIGGPFPGWSEFCTSVDELLLKAKAQAGTSTRVSELCGGASLPAAISASSALVAVCTIDGRVHVSDEEDHSMITAQQVGTWRGILSGNRCCLPPTALCSLFEGCGSCLCVHHCSLPRVLLNTYLADCMGVRSSCAVVRVRSSVCVCSQAAQRSRCGVHA
jgi:hypothetical protein